MNPFSSVQLHTENTELNENRILAHLDLDMFFAAVEIKHNPELRGKALIVGNPDARKTGRGVVLTASYEARHYGVHSGMPMIIALQKCPQAVISNAARKEYRPTSKRIMQILKNLKIPISITSVDEAYLDITTIAKDYQAAYEFAKELQQQIYEAEQLTCSVGIGPTLKIAKIGSDFRKPNGITVVTPTGLEQLFSNLPLKKIPGIGKVSAKKLHELGYNTCGELYNIPEAEIIQLIGSMGSYLYRIFQGKSTNRILPHGDRKSISHESTFHGDPYDVEKYTAIYDKLFEKTYKVLLKENFSTRTVNVKIRFNGFDTITRARSLAVVTKDRKLLYTTGFNLLSDHFNDSRGLRLLGIGFSNLEKNEMVQLSLTDFLSS